MSGPGVMSVRAVVGENVKRLREGVGATQEDLSAAVRAAGLRWPGTVIAALERGDKAVGVAELVVVADALSQLTGKPFTLADLFDGEGGVTLTDKLAVNRSAMRRLLNGDGAALTAGDTFDLRGRVTAAFGSGTKLLEQLDQFAGDASLQTVFDVASRAGEPEHRAAKTLGVTVAELAGLTARLWGRTLSEERDRRAGDEGTPRSRQARRGQVTRDLLAELRTHLAEAGRGVGC